jgi:hypothetical protein
MENFSVGHKQDASETHSPRVNQIQSPPDKQGEKEICCEDDFNTVTVVKPASIANTNA